jgi:DnaJ-class molecular chaperone|uniref:J domain-containing protein n=1 Tax=viral metagenome TaxID=1070528 RepID=A0A6C0IJ40_9ZZZZ
MSVPNHYQVLGVSENASESEIKKAYRGMSLKYHPDKNNTTEAQSKMHEINDAYSVLGDNEKKKQYDNQRKFQGRGGMSNAHINREFGDINSMFNSFFNQTCMNDGHPGNFHNNIRVFRNGQQVNINQRPNNISNIIHITLEQSYLGMTAPVEIERTVMRNNVKETEKETIYLEIPPGVDSNERITLKGKGHVVNEMSSDVTLTIQVQRHEMFERQGMDLVYKKDITLKEALCGFVLEFFHINGKKLTLNTNNNPYIITQGYRHTAREYGMVRNNIRGNLYIAFTVTFPSSLNDEQRETLDKIL